MLHFGHLDSLSVENPRIYEGSLMSDKVLAFFVLVWESLPGKVFKDAIVILVYSVPELGGTCMKEVDRTEIHVFLMPSEHCLPSSDIDVWLVDSRDLAIPQATLQN
jgi:hypothetical protein